MKLDIPETGSSIYLWMFQMGLKHIDWSRLVQELSKTSHKIRPKDEANYWRGWYKSILYHGKHTVSILNPPQSNKIKNFYNMKYTDYPIHPYNNKPEIDNRFVPCNDEGIPLIKWAKGCLTMEDANAYIGCKYIGENLKGCKFIVIDIDGDHGDKLHLNTVKQFHDLLKQTHGLIKPSLSIPISYHLTFKVNRVIPTMHFPKAHIDIVGNKMNSIRYFKNKKWNKLPPINMTNDIWNIIKNKIKRLEEFNE